MNKKLEEEYETILCEIKELMNKFDLTYEEAVKLVNCRTLRQIQYYTG